MIKWPKELVHTFDIIYEVNNQKTHLAIYEVSQTHKTVEFVKRN